MHSANFRFNELASIAARSALVVFGLLIVASCSGYVKYYPYFFDRDSAPAVRKVAVAPWNLLSPAPEYLRGKEAPLNDALISYLNGHSVPAQACKEAEKIWDEQKKQ